MGLSPRSWLDAAIFGGDLFGKIWGTKQQVGASDRAAEAELQANREALAFLEKQWNIAREDFAPYLKLGHTSAGRLTDYVRDTPSPTMPANLRQQMEGGYDPQTYTPRPGWTPPAAAPAAQRPATLGGSFGRPSDVIDLSRQSDGVFTTQPVPMPRTRMSDFGRTSIFPTTVQPTTTPMVMMEAPTGQRKAIPAARVGFFESRGARRI